MDSLPYPPEAAFAGIRDRGQEAFDRNDFAHAQTHFQQALDLLRAQPSPDRAVEINLLDWLGYTAQKQGRWEEAKRLHTEQHRLARATKDREAIANAHHRLADTLLELKELRSARCHLAAGLRHFRRLPVHPRTEVPHLLWDLARLAENAGDLPGARTRFLACARYLHEHCDPQLSNIYYQLGRLAMATNEWDTAEEMYSNALLAAQETGEALPQAYAYFGLGRVYGARKQPDKARWFYAESIRLAGMVGDNGIPAYAHQRLGLLDWDASRMTDSLRHFAMAALLVNRTGEAGQLCASLESTASALLALRHPAAAAQCLGRVDALREGQPSLPGGSGNNRRACESVLGEERSREWFRFGRMMTVDSVVHIALRIADAQPNTLRLVP